MLKDSATQDSLAMILQTFFLCLRMAYIERFVLLLLLSVASTHDSKFAMDVRNTCYLFGATMPIALTEQPCLLHTESIPKPSLSNTTPPQNPAIPIILITFYEYHWHVMSHAFFLFIFDVKISNAFFPQHVYACFMFFIWGNVLWLASFLVGGSAEYGADTPLYLCLELPESEFKTVHGRFLERREVKDFWPFLRCSWLGEGWEYAKNPALKMAAHIVKRVYIIDDIDWFLYIFSMVTLYYKENDWRLRCLHCSQEAADGSQ